MAACMDKAYKRCIEYAKSEHCSLIPLNTKEDFHKTMPEGIRTGPFRSWRGFWKMEGARWVFASNAMRAMHIETVRLDVKFITDSSRGNVKFVIFSERKDAVFSARTGDGVERLASQTILAAGANSGLLLDFQNNFGL
ncbi:hypothetical protein CC78DRAFT_578554 [Lojkania enalia]|uniref:Uncharacterized protein n=1 Tax=Lojkania enalia TaxID=147567 RepID=A0A9P4KCU2_9PLEO|nr:hypothetical protein CC78DRAFT_578554 [Didymosphaeria enalia]